MLRVGIVLSQGIKQQTVRLGKGAISARTLLIWPDDALEYKAAWKCQPPTPERPLAWGIIQSLTQKLQKGSGGPGDCPGE